MAVTTVPVKRVLISGVEPEAAVQDAGDGFTIPSNDGNIILRVTNPTADNTTIYFYPTATIAGMQLAPEASSVAAGQEVWFGPFPPVLFNDDLGAVAGLADTGVFLAAFGI